MEVCCSDMFLLEGLMCEFHDECYAVGIVGRSFVLLLLPEIAFAMLQTLGFLKPAI